MKARFVVVAAIVFCQPSLGVAGKVKVWHHCAPSHYEKAQFKGAVISNEGTVRLSRSLKPLTGIDATHVWDVVEDRQGNIFMATGNEGKLYKLTPEGKLSIAHTGTDSQILCLAQAPDGFIYAGTGPGGHVLRISPDGTTQVLCATSETYVWSLAVDSTGETIYAGTGPKGRIYQISREGKASVFYETKQDHVLSLAISPQGQLFAGTDKNGLVYRFDANAKGFVLFHAPQAEVRRLYWTDEGLFAGTSAPRRSGLLGSSAAQERAARADSSATLVSVRKAPTKISADEKGLTSGTTSASRDMEERGAPTARAAAPVSGENSVYRVAADGAYRELFRERALILSVLPRGGRLLVGTGLDGQLFEVDESTRERSEIARLENGQIHALYRRRDGSTVIGTGDPGKLYLLRDPYETKGTVLSEVLDAKGIGKWGVLQWHGEEPQGTRITVALRTGNLPDPDETWSAWSAEQSDSQESPVLSPSARYLQYRITLATENPAVTPALRSLSIRYRTANQAPEVTAIEVPDLDGTNSENPKRVKIKWTVTDPNEDDLLFNLLVRKDGWKNWVQVEEGYDKKEYEWDTSAMPSGIYQVKVVASDRKDNTPEEALTGMRVSNTFVVSHTLPTVAVKVAGMEGDQAMIEATATDQWVRLTSASFTVNGKKWVTVFPKDGLFDSKKEAFRFRTEDLKPGSYVVVLRVRDAAGNTGSGDVVFTVRDGQK